MKVGIITYHFVYNCGAALQCYALQKVLKKMGHTPKVINYKPWHLHNKYTHFKNPFEYYKNTRPIGGRKEGLKAFLNAMKTWRHSFKAKINDKKFKVFRDNYFDETRLYRTIAALRKSPPQCDFFISGSDQVWNPYLTNGKPDAAYFLDFGNEHQGRMTYAIGTDVKELEKHQDELKSLIQHFDSISLREKQSLPLLEKLSKKETEFHIDLDPTLLLEEEDFSPLESTEVAMDEPFILMYTMPDSSAEATRYAAMELGKKENMPVIDIAMRRVKRNNEMLEPHVASPEEFLYYLKHAKYVYTNSFHGTAFSVIYNKQFMAIPHRKTGHRVIELLEKLNLENRWKNTGGETLETMKDSIDYEAVNLLRKKIGQESINYIDRTLSKKAL